VISASIPCKDETAAKSMSNSASSGDLLGKISSFAKQVPGITKALGGKMDFGLGGLKTKAVERMRPKPKVASDIDKELAKVSAKNQGLQTGIAETSSRLERSAPVAKAPVNSQEAMAKVNKALKGHAAQHEPKPLPQTEAGYPAAVPARRRPRRFKEFRGRTWAYKGDALIIGKQIQHLRIDLAIAAKQQKDLTALIQDLETVAARERMLQCKDRLLHYKQSLQQEADRLRTQLDSLASQRDSARALPTSG